MQCPTCDHEGSVASFGEPLRCPECGAFYEKALELKLRRPVSAPPEPVRPSVPAPAFAKGLIPCRSCGTPISKNAASCPLCGAPAKKKTSLFTWIVAVLAGLWLFGFMVDIIVNPAPPQRAAASSSPSSPAPAPAPVVPPPISRQAQAEAATSIEKFTWSKSAGGALMNADFTIRNSGGIDVKDIEIECVHFGPSGTRIDKNTRTIYEIVRAGQTRVFRGFDMGFIHSQAETSNCSIKSLKI